MRASLQSFGGLDIDAHLRDRQYIVLYVKIGFERRRLVASLARPGGNVTGLSTQSTVPLDHGCRLDQYPRRGCWHSGPPPPPRTPILLANGSNFYARCSPVSTGWRSSAMSAMPSSMQEIGEVQARLVVRSCTETTNWQCGQTRPEGAGAERREHEPSGCARLPNLSGDRNRAARAGRLTEVPHVAVTVELDAPVKRTSR